MPHFLKSKAVLERGAHTPAAEKKWQFVAYWSSRFYCIALWGQEVVCLGLPQHETGPGNIYVGARLSLFTAAFVNSL